MKKKGFLEKLEENFIAAGIIAMVLMETISAFTRNINPDGLGIPQELAQFIYIWICFFSAAYCAKTGCNVVVDFISSMFSKSIQSFLKLVSYIVDGLLSLLFMFGAFEFVGSTMAAATSGVSGIPHWIVYIAPIVGFALSLFRNAQNCINHFKDIKGGAVA